MADRVESRADKRASGANNTIIIENRAMHGFSIPAYTYKSCACGQLWLGPAYAVIDDQGYFWNCPGCEHLFKPPQPEESTPEPTPAPKKKTPASKKSAKPRTHKA